MKSITHNLKNLFSGMHNTSLAVICGVLFVGYFACIIGTIVAVNERKDIRLATRNLHMSVAELESNYVQLSSSITKDRAFALGYVEAVDPDFAYVDPENLPEQVALIP